jgi:hypothetical protein
MKLFRPRNDPVLRGSALLIGDEQAFLWTAGYVARLDAELFLYAKSSFTDEEWKRFMRSCSQHRRPVSHGLRSSIISDSRPAASNPEPTRPTEFKSKSHRSAIAGPGRASSAFGPTEGRRSRRLTLAALSNTDRADHIGPSSYARRALTLSSSLLVGCIVLPLLIAVTLLQRSKTELSLRVTIAALLSFAFSNLLRWGAARSTADR